MTSAELVVFVVASALLGFTVLYRLTFGPREHRLSRQCRDAMPQPEMPQRPPGRATIPTPPGHHGYRAPAGKPTLEERVEALERAEAARTLREMASDPVRAVPYEPTHAEVMEARDKIAALRAEWAKEAKR